MRRANVLESIGTTFTFVSIFLAIGIVGAMECNNPVHVPTCIVAAALLVVGELLMLIAKRWKNKILEAIELEEEERERREEYKRNFKTYDLRELWGETEN